VTGSDPPLPGLGEILRRNDAGELHRVSLERHMVIEDKRLELTRRLGAGGFGQVWEAWHIELEQKRAIKFLDGKHRDLAAVRARFRAEAQLLAQLDSKHLVRVWDYGELADGVPYFVMELVQGLTLRQRMSEPLPLHRAVEIAAQLLDGLAEVHARGLTHGDVKPENIILSGPEEEVRVLDFGLAQISTRATGVGGTPPYMAPELVLEGKPPSPRADVYAVGVVLYEMLTGELPRGHVSMGIDRIRRSWEMKPTAAPMRMLRKEIPTALDELVMKALSKDPSLRFATAGEMAEALRVLEGRISAGLADTVLPDSPSAKATTEREVEAVKPELGKRRWGLVAGLVVGAAALLGLGWNWWGEGEEPAVAAAALAKPSPREPAEARASSRLPAGVFASAKDGVVLAVVEASPARVNAAYGALCSALRGAGKRLLCTRLPAGTSSADAIEAADADGVRVVLLVGEEIVVRSTSHDRGSRLVRQLEGLPLPRESAIGDVAIVLRAVIDPVGSKDELIPVLEPSEWDPRWVVLAEWLRARRGQGDPDAAARLADATQALGDRAGFAHDLAVILRARYASCEVAAGPITELTEPGVHEPGIRIWALLELAACAVNGNAVRLDRAERAEALVEQALEASGGHPCVHVAALGTISRIDLWRGNDALWQQHGRAVSRDACDDPAAWSRVMSVRGDALAAAGHWCEAASAHEQAYHEMPTRVVPLLAWAETSWRCEPNREADRDELLPALERGIASRRFGAADRASLAYSRWWLTREPADAQRVLDQYATIELGKPALLEGVGSDLEQELCEGADERECSLTIMRSPKQPGHEARLRAALGLRR
jgi:hypothetical protein